MTGICVSPYFCKSNQRMKLLITLLVLILPMQLLAQFGVSEYYVSANSSFSIGMNNYTYLSTLDGQNAENPQFIQLELGSGISAELALGLKLTKYFYAETSLIYMRNQDFYTVNSGGNTVDQGFSFNRFNIQLNGKFFEEISQKLLLDFSMGVAYSIPDELIVKIGTETESIKYAGSAGFQAGFGFNYRIESVSIHGGLRYRLERFTIKSNQGLPDQFKVINADFGNISSSGIDILIGVQYNF